MKYSKYKLKRLMKRKGVTRVKVATYLMAPSLKWFDRKLARADWNPIAGREIYKAIMFVSEFEKARRYKE